MVKIEFDLPAIQILFANALQEIRSECLQDALSAAVASMQIQCVDQELYEYANAESLQVLAAQGLRGELLFAVPCVLSKNPRLLGYYRLLLGYSQKYFYSSATGAGIFESMEKSGRLSEKQHKALPALCRALSQNAQYLLAHLSSSQLSASFLDQLTLLTLGPQFRGRENVQKGSSAILQVFDVILQIVSSAVVSSSVKCIELKNSSGRTVFIQFAADPDIVIREELAPALYRNLVAIEVKGGRDYSNIHNRIGEAEKSHQKAKKDGYIECWTVVNVDRVNMDMACRESPTTNQFYRISELLDHKSPEYKRFMMQLISIVGI